MTNYRNLTDDDLYVIAQRNDSDARGCALAELDRRRRAHENAVVDNQLRISRYSVCVAGIAAVAGLCSAVAAIVQVFGA